VVQVHPGPLREEESMAKDKDKGGKKKWFFIGAIVAAFAAFFAIFRRRRNRGIEESEWQELPPPEGT
jgi:hypothetical protein